MVHTTIQACLDEESEQKNKMNRKTFSALFGPEFKHFILHVKSSAGRKQHFFGFQHWV